MEDCERDVICEERGYNEKESSEENDFWAQKTEWYANRHVRCNRTCASCLPVIQEIETGALSFFESSIAV
jgi:hypothetical protein